MGYYLRPPLRSTEEEAGNGRGTQLSGSVFGGAKDRSAERRFAVCGKGVGFRDRRLRMYPELDLNFDGQRWH
jgi:hypothetical protein